MSPESSRANRTILSVIMAALLAVCAGATLAQAGEIRHFLNGFYGEAQPDHEALSFRVRRNNISQLRLNMLIACTTVATGEQNVSFFTLAGAHSFDLPLSLNGRSTGSFDVDDANRAGTLNWNIRLRGSKGTAIIALVVHNDSQQCEGVNTFHLRLAPKH